ncbi:DUF5000 domain-containing lipoprotein [Polaribacter butkevichii]|uniref:Galactose-binding protein n=1 Tax=Polaribacter butkevichii TaxID=218490 RepID=A0A2P6C6V3_9FLAO|nr:DUF5000 domain-containing lipoprotein [Polaribacter butkevichii]PQJ68657.1 hypothetical protein BTO14_11410 [Polaribacter butkevichii]
MRNLIFKTCLCILCIVATLTSCDKSDNFNEPLSENSTVPEQLTNISVTNAAGKSKITYSLPKDDNLLYVKALYKLDTGKEIEVKSSFYKKTIELDGFSIAGPREVSLVTVSRNEIESAPIIITVNPLDSPIYDIYKSLTVGPDFGGLFLEAKNPERADIAILVMEKDENGDWETTANSVYTGTDEIFRTVRGLDTISRDFAFTIRDRFLNTSDTLFQAVKPIFETEIPRTQYAGFPLPGDAPTNDFGFGLDRLFDNNFIGWPRIYITDASAPAPHSFTIDLGQELKISRVKIWDYPQGTAAGYIYYWQFNMRNFEIWGSNNPSADGSFDSWDLLGTYEVVKPSGLPLTQQNAEDLEFAQDGFNWPIPITSPKYRYLRINNLKNWAGGGRLAIAEMRVYGDPR